MSAIVEPIKVEPGAHVVHFYRDDADLAVTVGGHLAEALRDDAVVIAIATEPHLSAFEREFDLDGIDAAGAAESGSLIMLDASATLAELEINGQISRHAFQQVVGTLVRNATGRGRTVRAYGEMVDLLWREGDIPGAIELEKLWNELIAELPFSLLCAYRSEDIAAPEHEHAVRDVCQLHTMVSSANEVSRRFEPQSLAPSAARRFLDETLQRWGHGEDVAEDARLLLSELVSNAVVHAKSPMSVSIRSQPSGLRVSVADESPIPPIPRLGAVNGSIGGHGLRLIAALSESWGVDANGDGKIVWAEL
jgi:anti-sigma regulatory factor (Ser/Thr protein kinase)